MTACLDELATAEGSSSSLPLPVALDRRTHRDDAGLGLRPVRPSNSHVALGMATSLLMGDPAFARLPFGHWTRVLVGQINRRHFVFIADGSRIAGFAGWALATRELAEAWLEGTRDLSFEESKAGEIVVVNAWKATTPAAHRALVDAVRRVIETKEAVYYKRYYAHGHVRRVRLNVNEFVGAHVDRKRVSLSG